MCDKEYTKMTVNLLKEELKRRGLDQSGKKADLVSRLETNDMDTSAKEEAIDVLPLLDTLPQPDDNSSDIDKVVHEEHEDDITAVEECEGPSDQSAHETPQNEDHSTPAEIVLMEVAQGEPAEDVSGIAVSEEVSSCQGDFEKESQEKADEYSEPHSCLNQMAETAAVNDCEATSSCQEDKSEEKTEFQTQPETGNGSLDASSQDTTGTSNQASAENDALVSSRFGIEMKRERDAFQLRWNGKKFTVPFIGEIVSDLAAEVSQRSFLVRPVTLDDVLSSCFQEIISSANKFLLDFQEHVLESSTFGFAKFVCKTNEDCMKFRENLRNYKEDLVVEAVSFEDQLNHQFLNRDPMYNKGSIADRLLYVGNLPCGVAECTVRDLFPDALRVIIPPLKDLDKSINTARYIYLEYSSADDIIGAAEKYKEVVLDGEKLFIIKALCVKKERFGLLTDTLRTILLDKVRKMRKIQKNPWNKSRQELQEIEKTISLNMEKLTADSKHRKNWGMELGALDENRLDQEEPERIDSIAEKGRGGRGGQSRGGPSRSSYDSRRGHSNVPHRYSGYGNSYNSRGGWSGSSYYGSPGYMNSSYMNNQNYSGGYGMQESYFNKRKASDNYGGDWKRGRHY